MYDQNPECDVAGCNRPAMWILLADIDGADSLLCPTHWQKLQHNDPTRAKLFGPLNEIVIRHGPVSSPANENA